MKPMDIEKKSMEIIESELSVPVAPEYLPIVKRVIHTTADFSFAQSLYFTDGIVPLLHNMMKDGATIFTDTNMALSGINKPAAKKLGIQLHCIMADENIAKEAKEREVTRATVCMEHILKQEGKKILVCGNAPTFLMPLLAQSNRQDIAVIGVPVGFVNVVEVKEALKESGIPSIIAMGRRGGSNVAASIINALMYTIDGVRT